MAPDPPPPPADLALAAGVLAVALAGLAAGPRDDSVFRDPAAVAGALLTLAAALLALRRRAPLGALAGSWLATGAYLAIGYFPATTAFLAPVVAVYSAGAHAPHHRRAAGVVLAATLATGVVLLTVASPPDLRLAEATALVLLLGGAAVVGDRVRTRRLYLAAQQERADLAERERSARERAAVAEERARIARELHDIVAHGVSVIVLHARGAQAALDADPAAARRSLALIEATGREALGELRTLVGALHAGGDGADGPLAEPGPGPGGRSPQPGLDDLPRLVEATRAAGLDVDLRTEGAPAPVPATVGLSAYRIVQEALANVIKHSAASAATVTVRHGPANLLVQVSDGGPPRPDPAPGGGHGLVGMRQRVDLLGGRLEAGPRPGGGFDVVAVLPFEAGGAG